MVITDNVTFELAKVRAVFGGLNVQSRGRPARSPELTDLLTAATQTLSDELTGLKGGLPTTTCVRLAN